MSATVIVGDVAKLVLNVAAETPQPFWPKLFAAHSRPAFHPTGVDACSPKAIAVGSFRVGTDGEVQFARGASG